MAFNIKILSLLSSSVYSASLLFSLLLTLFLISDTTDTLTAAIKVNPPPLASLNLADLSDEQINEYCISDQIKNYRPALKSLESRETISLDGQYDFCFDPKRKGFSQSWQSKSLRSSCDRQPDDMLFQMPVPSAFNSVTSTSFTHNYVGWFWYQRTFSLQTEQKHDKQMMLQFESVNYLALVWLQPLDSSSSQDATLLGSHVGGHLPFVFNISEIVEMVKGQDRRKFRLTIAVNNKLTEDTIPSGRMLDLSIQVGRHYEIFKPDFDFFHFSGILNSIKLIRLPPIHLSRVERLPKKHGHRYSSMVWLEVCLGGNLSQLKIGKWKLVAKLQQLDDDSSSQNSIIAEQSRPLDVDLKCDEISLEFSSKQVQEWKLARGNPNHQSALYLTSVELTNVNDNDLSEIVIDVYEFHIAFKPELTLFTSGGQQTHQLQGFGLHQEQLFSGRTMSLSSIMKDIYLLKQMGTNVVRTSHYPYSSDFLNACDRHGLLVIAECPAVGLESFSELKLELHKQILREMMERDNHHPSILMWSIANEPSSHLKPAEKYFQQLVEFARTDLARYTTEANRSLTAAIAQSERVDLIGDMLDVVMVNRYMGWYEATGVIEAIRLPLLESLCGWSERLPGKPLLISEFGAEALSGLHRYSPVDIYSEEYQRNLLLEHERLFDKLWAANRSNNNNINNSSDEMMTNMRVQIDEFNCSENINFIGSMIWNFADFSTDVSIERIGSVNRKGIFTRDRQPKMAASFIKQIYLSRIGLS